MALHVVVVLALSFLALDGAYGEITSTNVTLPTELTTKTVEVDATKVDVQQRKPNMTGDTPHVNCSGTGASVGDNFHWTRANGSEITPDDGIKQVRVPDTGTLDRYTVVSMLKFPDFDTKGGSNVGMYKCKLGSETRAASVFSAPVVKMSEKDSRSVMEGDALTQTCTIVAYPTAAVVWKKNNEIVTTDGGRIKFLAENRTMTISELKKEDAGVYVCSASNSLGVGEAYIKLRVKDRLAALWPFLGIVAEVAVLVTIILLYEKKRAAQKRSQEEQDTAEVKEDRNANDSDLRHRPVKT